MNTSSQHALKLLFNAGPLKPPLTGIGYYSRSLLIALQARLTPEQLSVFSKYHVHSWQHFYAEEQIRQLAEVSGNHQPSLKEKVLKLAKPIVKSVPFAYSARLWIINQMIHKCLQEQADQGRIYHETNYIPLPYKGKTVITVHDMAHVHNPSWHPKERVAYLNKYLPEAITRADAIITDSEFSRTAILECFPVADDKIFVTLLGKDLECIPYSALDTAATLAALKLKHHGYIFSACTLEPRKNLIRLVTAHQQLPQDMRKEYPLVLSGAQGWRLPEWNTLVTPLVERGEVILLGYLPRQQLLHVYASAIVFAYPSLYEGFGLPIIEAMACGTPVLTSNIGAMQEVAGDAALTIDPLSIDDITQGLSILLEDQSLRETYIKQGITRSQIFSWDHCATQTLDVYQRLR